MLTPLAVSPRQLREFFTESGYTHEQFVRNPLLRDLPSSRLGNLPTLLANTDEPTPLNILLRWFFLGEPQDHGRVAGQVPAAVIRELLETGLLVQEESRLIPAAMLNPCETSLFAADPARMLESADSSGLVLWPNPSTRLLQMFTIRRPFGETLDLGAGCGILAVLAAGHSGHVVATDLNPRTSEFIAFNAWLNEVSNVEWLTGDTFGPVEGRTFDLIFSNPPFFVTPSGDQIFCESRFELDGFCRELVRAAPAYLNEGGYLQITLEWVELKGQAWQDRLMEWLKDSGCDVWALRCYARSAADYASERIGRMMPYSPESVQQRHDDWMKYYRARNVEEIHGGILAMRKRTGANWVRIEEAPGLDFSEPFGHAIDELFANQDRLETDRSIAQMLAWRPRVAPDARIDQQLHWSAGQWKPLSTQIKRSVGLPSSLAMDPQVMEFLRRCDGTRTLSELAQDLAAAVKVNLEQVRQDSCAIIRKLAERRLVLL
jgi:methylase of polypeptide subunit release factors